MSIELPSHIAPRRRVFFVARAVVAMIAFCICSGRCSAQSPTDTWLGATGNWSVAADWLSGTAPPAGGDIGRVLGFTVNAGSYTATNNLGGTFQLNGLRFDGSGSTASTVTIANAAGNSLQLSGASPFIQQNAGVNVVISAAAGIGAETSIGGTGYGALTLSGVLSGGVGAGADALLIDGSGVLPAVAGVPGGSTVTVSGANTFTGNTQLGNANLVLGSNSALGATANQLVVRAANNSLAFTGVLTIPNPVTVNGTLTFVGNNGGTLSGAIGGSGGVTIAGAATLTLTAASNYGGATTVGVPGGGTGGLTLSGAGALNATSSIVLGAGGPLLLSNTAAAHSTNRIADTVPLTFQNGQLSFTAAPVVNVASGETFGPVIVQGSGSIAVTPASQSGTSSVLQFGSLSRIDNGTLFIQNVTSTGQTVGGGPAGPNRTNIFFAGGLPTLADPAGVSGGQNTAIVPFLSGGVGNPATNIMGTVATYDANGVRLLSPTDSTVFAQPTSVLVPHVNNNLNGFSYFINGTTTVTSLVASGGAPNLESTGTVQVASGAVVVATPLTFSGPTLAFGATTGYLHLGNSLTFEAGAITGSGGLVVSSANSSALVLGSFGAGSTNPFNGGLYVNGNASVTFTSDVQLGAAGQPVTLNGGTLASGYAETVNRPIILGPGGGSMAGPYGPAIFAGPISGAGGLTVASNSIVTLSGANSYSGPTTLNGTVTLAGSNTGGGATIITQGTTYFTSAANFSSGPIILNGGMMSSLSGGAFARDLTVASSSSTFSVGTGQTVTYTGNLSGSGTFYVGGGGTFVLSTGSPAIAGLAATGATFVVTGGTNLSTTALTAGSGGLVRLDDTGGIGRLGPHTPVSVQAGGELEMDGGNLPTTESFGALTANGTVTIIAGSGATAALSTASLSVPLSNSPALFRGTNLGGSAANSTSINVVNLAVGTVILNALADTSASGTGQDQAFYGTSGIRPAVASDFTSGLILQNAAPTNTPITADFRISGAVTTAGSSNTVRSLRLEPGETLTIPSGTLNAGGYIYAAGGGASTIAGPGTLQKPTTVLTMGDLNVSAALVNESLFKSGPGTLTLSGPVSFSSLNVSAGTLVLNSSQTVSVTSAVTVNSNLVLGTPSTVLNIGFGLFDQAATVISGPGGIATNTFIFVNGANTYSGGSTGGPNGEFIVFQPTSLGTGPVTLANVVGTANPTTLLQLTFSAGTFANDVNLPTTNSFSEIDGFSSTMSGRFRGGNTATGTAVQFSGNLTNPNNDFTATVVVGSTLGIASNSVLGNAANVVQLSGGILRFNADGIVVPRPISVTVYGGTIDTGSYGARISGTISGSGPVYKDGTGTLTLGGANTFTGDLDIFGGLALVTGSLTAATNGFNGVDVERGTSFGGTGTVNRTVTGFGGIIAPGLLTANGKLTVASFTDFGASTLAFRINGSSVGDGTTLIGYDRLITTAASGLQLDFTSLTATVGGGFDPTILNTPIFIIDDQSSAAVSGTFENLPNGALVNLGGFTAYISYFGDTGTNSITGGNDVVLYNFQAVPEPSSLLLLGGATVGFATWLRRRRCPPPS
jgi:fibronectin-binding autotransporter adhesin